MPPSPTMHLWHNGAPRCVGGGSGRCEPTQPRETLVECLPGGTSRGARGCAREGKSPEVSEVVAVEGSSEAVSEPAL